MRGKRHFESSGSVNRADAVRLLKRRHAEAGAGKPVGSQIERTTLADLITMLVNDYRANQRRSTDRAEQARASTCGSSWAKVPRPTTSPPTE